MKYNIYIDVYIYMYIHIYVYMYIYGVIRGFLCISDPELYVCMHSKTNTLLSSVRQTITRNGYRL